MEKERNNKRTANYTKEECWRLVEIVERFMDIIENKKTDALTWKDKKTAWQKICVQFNSLGTQNRTWEQLRSKYETLKKETRKAAAKCRTDILCTGGGPSEAQPFNPLYEKIRAIIKLSADGTPSCFDSDYIDAEAMAGNVSTCFNTPIVTNNDCLFQEESSLVLDDLPPCTSEDNLLCTSGTALISKEANSDASNKKVSEESIPKTPTIVQENSKTDVAEVNNTWSSYCPAQLKRPRHPALQTPNRKRLHENRNQSAAGQKMQPWVDAKTELTSLKIKLLQEEFNLKQQREQELHAQQLQTKAQQLQINAQQLQINAQQLQINSQQLQINELTIEKLKSEIKRMKNE